jgi:hypothetical protein
MTVTKNNSRRNGNFSKYGYRFATTTQPASATPLTIALASKTDTRALPQNDGRLTLEDERTRPSTLQKWTT